MTRTSITAALVACTAFAIGMGAAYAVGGGSSRRGFMGSYRCENFGLPDKTFGGLKVDRDLKVYGVARDGKQVAVGHLDPHDHDLASFEPSKETLAWRESTVDPFADYIVDNAGDALLILEMQGERARMSYVCRRD